MIKMSLCSWRCYSSSLNTTDWPCIALEWSIQIWTWFRTPTLLKYLEKTCSLPVFRPGDVWKIGKKRWHVSDVTVCGQNPSAWERHMCFLSFFTFFHKKTNSVRFTWLLHVNLNLLLFPYRSVKMVISDGIVSKKLWRFLVDRMQEHWL